MVTRELLESVVKLKDAGATPEDVRTFLEEHGWSEADIKEVLDVTYRPSAPPEKEQEPPKSPTSSPAKVPAKPEGGSATAPRQQRKKSPEKLAGPSELAHGAFMTIKTKFWSLIGVVFFSFILGAAALYLLYTALSSLSLSFFDLPLSQLFEEGAELSTASLVTAAPLMAVVVLLMAIVLVWLPASLIAVTASQKGGVIYGMRRGFMRQGALFVTLLLTVFFTGVGTLFLIVPGVLFCIWFGFAPFVAVLERKAGIPALVQSRAYMQDRFWQVMGRQIFLLVPAIFLLLFFLLIAFPLLYFGDTQTLSGAETAYIVFALVALITVCIFFLFFVLGYEMALYEDLKRNTRSALISGGLGNTLFVLAIVVILSALGAALLFPDATRDVLSGFMV